MSYFKLKKYDIKEHDSGNTIVLCTGASKYYSIIVDTYPQYRFSSIFTDYKHVYDWGMFITGINLQQREEIRIFLELLTKVFCIKDNLQQSFAMGRYYDDPEHITKIGEVVNQAKYFQSTEARDLLYSYFYRFIFKHPAYRRSDFLISVPSSQPSKIGLCYEIVNRLSIEFNIQNGTKLVRKTRPTQPMKSLSTLKEKFDNITGSFEVSTESLLGKRVTLIDDVYSSGTTINELAQILKQKGAVVQSLVATKTLRNIKN